MYRLLVWTSKGGTGKTTTVANTAPELARLGYRVLMVGFDPQADLESTFGIEEDSDVARIEQLLDGGGDPLAAALDIEVPALPRRIKRRRRDGGGRLQLLPCSSQLLSHTAAIARRRYQDLDQLLGAFDRGADIALIDTQGALTPISHTAALAADGVLFVGEPGYYEFRALASRLAELEELRRDEGLEIAPIGLLFVRCSARSRQMREYREHYEDAEAFGGERLHVFKAHTRQQSSVRDHPRLRRPTVIAEPDSHAAQDYRAFAAELVDRLAAIAQGQRNAHAA
jgi:cellulose biosynthesis protein BcsQ